MQLTGCLWDEAQFREYADYCLAQDYCSPWHPYVGPKYGQNENLRFAYYGGSAWWNSDTSKPQKVDDSRILTKGFVEGPAFKLYSTPFWRFFDRLGALVFPEARTRSEITNFSVWSNLSKTGMVGKSAPPGADKVLRGLDVRQLRREFDLLEPDIILCVSGSLVPSTGHAIFGGWKKIAGLEARTASTWIRQSPWGGFLLWTMHPAYKSEDWALSVENDLKLILATQSRETRPVTFTASST